jgi:hypothetical protein
MGRYTFGRYSLSVYIIGGSSLVCVNLLIPRLPVVFLKDVTGLSSKYLIISMSVDPAIVLTAVIIFSGAL